MQFVELALFILRVYEIHKCFLKANCRVFNEKANDTCGLKQVKIFAFTFIVGSIMNNAV